MSPENYETFVGNVQIFDAFSNDVWGLGIILLCCFSTESFLWMAPDKKCKDYRKIMQNIPSTLKEAFKIDMQQNESIKANLVLLTDLLQKIFVEEECRIDIDEVLAHKFFSDSDNQAKSIGVLKHSMLNQSCCLPSCRIL